MSSRVARACQQWFSRGGNESQRARTSHLYYYRLAGYYTRYCARGRHKSTHARTHSSPRYTTCYAPVKIIRARPRVYNDAVFFADEWKVSSVFQQLRTYRVYTHSLFAGARRGGFDFIGALTPFLHAYIMAVAVVVVVVYDERSLFYCMLMARAWVLRATTRARCIYISVVRIDKRRVYWGLMRWDASLCIVNDDVVCGGVN